jgi:hypothetical protein
MTASPRRVGDKRALPVTIPTGMSVCGLENSSPFNDLMWRYPVFLARAEAAHEASEALPLTGRRKPSIHPRTEDAMSHRALPPRG